MRGIYLDGTKYTVRTIIISPRVDIKRCAVINVRMSHVFSGTWQRDNVEIASVCGLVQTQPVQSQTSSVGLGPVRPSGGTRLDRALPQTGSVPTGGIIALWLLHFLTTASFPPPHHIMCPFLHLTSFLPNSAQYAFWVFWKSTSRMTSSIQFASAFIHGLDVLQSDICRLCVQPQSNWFGTTGPISEFSSRSNSSDYTLLSSSISHNSLESLVWNFFVLGMQHCPSRNIITGFAKYLALPKQGMFLNTTIHQMLVVSLSVPLLKTGLDPQQTVTPALGWPGLVGSIKTVEVRAF